MFKFLIALATVFGASVASAQFGGPGGWGHPGHPGGPGGGWGHPGGPGGISREILRCDSNNNQQNYCQADGWLRSANLYRQYSNSPCIAGQTWGWQRDGVWVTGGCRADFVVDVVRQGPGPGPGPIPPPPPPPSNDIHCKSDHFRYNTCSANGYIVQAQLLRQTSDSSCDYGRSWGWTGNGLLWVDKGCEGDFRVYFR